MEIQEGEMSMFKALVALNPEKLLLSILTPKLKNVSQLRTEHQGYVLPDSHQLLEDMLFMQQCKKANAQMVKRDTTDIMENSNERELST